MALHDAGERELCSREGSSHKLAWTLDACLKVCCALCALGWGWSGVEWCGSGEAQVAR